VLQEALATDESEFLSIIDMTGVGEDRHTIRVDMHRLWSSGERLTSASKEAAIEYTPVKREDRLIRVPTIKSAAGAGLEILSDTEKSIYEEIESEMRRESDSRRDYW